MSKPYTIHWDNIGIIGGVSVYELCDFCKNRCTHSRTGTQYITKCSKFECRREDKDTLEHIDKEFIAKHKD